MDAATHAALWAVRARSPLLGRRADAPRSKVTAFLASVLTGLVLGGAAPCIAAEPESLDKAEILVASDPGRALAALDTIETGTNASAVDPVELLCVRGEALVALHRHPETLDVVQRLEARSSDPNASAAAALVRAGEFIAEGGYAQALGELQKIPAASAGRDTKMLYRRLMLRGAAESPLGQFAAAVSSFQEAQLVAVGIPSPARELAAQLGAAHTYVKFGELETAARVLAEARQEAARSGDEWSLLLISREESDIFDRRSDRAGERRASLETLAHARRVGSNAAMVEALVNLGDSYLKTKEYAASLRNSEEGMRLIGPEGTAGTRSVVLFNIGLARLGLHDLRAGKSAAEQAINEVRGAGNRESAIGMLQEYSDALESIGEVPAALAVLRRQQELQRELLTVDRQRVMLELTQRFASERQERSIALLQNDNALKSSELKAQTSREWAILSVAILVVVAGALLAFAYRRVHRLNNALQESSVRDALTGLHNRRHFQDIAGAQAGYPEFSGSLFLLDIDHFKTVNDEFGHAAGDAVLMAVGERLQSVLRGSDVLVRWGGEEFLIAVVAAPAMPCGMLAERLMKVVSTETIVHDGCSIRCTMSVGYANFPIPGCVPEISIERALALVDQALYVAKRNGRARACGIAALNATTVQEIRSIEKGFVDAQRAGLLRLIEQADTASHEELVQESP
jgi:diguanylate cyclase (GGDEF)-like protein